MPMMPRSRLAANAMRVPMNVTRSTRMGIAYQRGGRGVGMVLGYTSVWSARSKAAGEGARSTQAWVVYKRADMSQAAPAITRSPADVVRMTPVAQAGNGICYAAAGESSVSALDLERMIAAVPLTVSQGEEILIADRYDVALSDNAVCHRNLNLGDSQCVFISTRLSDDKFSVAFEFYINVGHALVEVAGLSHEFSELAWKQVEAGTRGETSLDAWEARKLATAGGPDAERFKNEYFEATFSDTISIYMLSLYLDVDYYDLRERDYPLLAPSALAERLRKVAELFPANPGFEFAVFYKRRS
jgi:hypothetical protein